MNDIRGISHHNPDRVIELYDWCNSRNALEDPWILDIVTPDHIIMVSYVDDDSMYWMRLYHIGPKEKEQYLVRFNAHRTAWLIRVYRAKLNQSQVVEFLLKFAN